MRTEPIVFERRSIEANRQVAVINGEITRIRKECPGSADPETERQIRRLLIQRNWVYVELSHSRTLGDRRRAVENVR